MKKNEKVEKTAAVREVKSTKLGRVVGAATVAVGKSPAANLSTRIL
jgi:hypothetical protein